MVRKIKGQSISLDYVVAFLVFLGLVALILYLLNILPGGQQVALQQRANQVADYLSGQFQDCDKLRNLTQESYERVRTKLNIAPYDFYVDIENFNASLCGDVRPKLDLVLMMDTSADVVGLPLDQEKNGATNITNGLKEFCTLAACGELDYASLVSYSSTASILNTLKLMDDANKTTINNFIDGLSAGTPGIKPSNAIDAANSEWDNNGREDAKKVGVLILGSMFAEPMNNTDANAINSAIASCYSDARIFTINYGMLPNSTISQEIASITKAKMYQANTPSEIFDAAYDIYKNVTGGPLYGIKPPSSTKYVSSVVRIISVKGLKLRMIVNVYERVPDLGCPQPVTVPPLPPDTTPPTVTVTLSPPGGVYNSSGTVTFTVTSSDDSGKVKDVTLYIDSNSVSLSCNADNTTCTYASTFSIGTHDYFATAKDFDENQGRYPAAGVIQFTIVQCNNGATQSCLVNDPPPGIGYQQGVQTCVNNQWGSCFVCDIGSTRACVTGGQAGVQACVPSGAVGAWSIICNTPPANLVILGTNYGEIHAYDAATGDLYWRYRPPAVTSFTWGTPAYMNGVVYAGADNGILYAINATTGEGLWSFLATGSIQSSIMALNDSVYFQTAAGTVYKVNTFDHQMNWSYQVVPAGAWNQGPVSSPVYMVDQNQEAGMSEPLIAFGGANGNMYAVHDDTGTLYGLSAPKPMEWHSSPVYDGPSKVIYAANKVGDFCGFIGNPGPPTSFNEYLPAVFGGGQTCLITLLGDDFSSPDYSLMGGSPSIAIAGGDTVYQIVLTAGIVNSHDINPSAQSQDTLSSPIWTGNHLIVGSLRNGGNVGGVHALQSNGLTELWYWDSVADGQMGVVSSPVFSQATGYVYAVDKSSVLYALDPFSSTTSGLLDNYVFKANITSVYGDIANETVTSPMVCQTGAVPWSCSYPSISPMEQ